MSDASSLGLIQSLVKLGMSLRLRARAATPAGAFS